MFHELKDFVPQFKYCGTFYRAVRFNKNFDELVLITEPAVNSHQIKLKFYYNGTYLKAMRYNKDTFTYFLADQAIRAIYWEKFGFE